MQPVADAQPPGLDAADQLERLIDLQHGAAQPDRRQAPPERTFLFVFQQQGPAPVARGMVLGPGTIMDIARQEVEQAKLRWVRCWETFGPDAPWVDTTEIGTFDDVMFPRSSRQSVSIPANSRRASASRR